MTISTTEPVSKLKKSAQEASKWLGEEITLKRVKVPKKAPTTIDKDGEVRINFAWLLNEYGNLHITPDIRRRWKLTTAINGSSKNVNKTPVFYLIANPNKKAKGYPFSEVTRLIIHERMHAKAPKSVVHRWDYEKQAIHLLARDKQGVI